MLELAKLIDLIVGFASPMVQSKLQRSELVIKLLKQLHLDPDHPPADFTAVYQYTLVEYGIGKPKPVLEIFRQAEIQALFRKALDQNHPSLLLQEGETFLSGHSLGDQIQALGIDARQEFYQFAAVFIEVAKRTRTPAEVLSNQRLESLHRQIGSMQERLHRLPTLEAMRTEMARLAAQRSESVGEWMSGRVDESTHRPIDPSTPPLTPSSIFALAQQMKGWFETLGYRFESYEVWQDDYFEWIIDIPVRRGRYDRILVRGVDGEVGLSDIKALRQSVETQRADEGWLVTARRISRAAREAVEQEENHDLGCYTFDELLDQDADFGGYLDWLEAEIGRRGIDQKYVPLACTKEEIDPDTKQRLGVSRYDDRDGWIDGYIDLWLDDPAKEHISVLGEFGTGKTWFAFHYASQALKRYREAQQRGVERPRLPLVIPLRDYAKAVSVESLFSEFFFRKHEVRSLTYSAFEQLNRMGKLLLIFDGFDEMAARVDRQEMINNFWELAKVVVPGAKVILTCRTEHFPEAREGRALLNAQLQASTASLTGEMPQFEVLELEKFNDEQIRQAMSQQAEVATVEQVMSNPQLLDLARRPVMTELILEALPDIEAGKPVDMSRVYLYAVRRKMERDIKEERTFTSLAEKLYFLCELSWEMLSSDRMSLNYREFPDRIRRLFGSVVQEEKDLDHWHYDMMGQTMLIRNADGDYMPAHRSLLEFFVAYKFAAELGALAPDFLELAQAQHCLDTSAEPQDYTWSDYFYRGADINTEIVPTLQSFSSEKLEILKLDFGRKPLTKAVIDLMLPMLIPIQPSSLHPLITLLKSIKDKSHKEIGYLGGNIAKLLVRLDKYSLENLDLSHTTLLEADFSEAFMRQTNLTGCNLTGSSFAQRFGLLISTAFSPNSNLIAIGQIDGKIWLWRIEDNQLVLALEGHTGAIRSLVFSSDGELLVSGSADNTLRVWEVNTGKCIHTLREHTKVVWSVAIDPKTRIIASGSRDQTIKLWQPETGICIGTLQGHTGEVCSIAFSPDGETLISGSGDQTIRLWQLSTKQCVQVLYGHTDTIRSIALSPSGRFLASGSDDKTLRVWSLNTGECQKIFEGHHAKIRSVAYSPDETLIASSSNDCTIKLWHTRTNQCVQTCIGHTTWVLMVTFSPNGKKLASCCHDQSLRLWDVATGQCSKILQGYKDSVQSLAFSSDEQLLASGSVDELIRVWQTKTGQCIKTIDAGNSWIYSLAFSPDGKTIASTSLEPVINLWQVETGQHLVTLRGHDESVMLVAFSPDGNFLVSVDRNYTVMIWRIITGERVNTFQQDRYSELNFSIASDGQLNLVNGQNSDENTWRVSSNEGFELLPRFGKDIHHFAASPMKNFIATVDEDTHEVIKIWQLNTGEMLRELKFDKPYTQMNITGVKGLTEAEKVTLKALGAIED